MDLISDSHVPKYAQIADIFRQRIARGIWSQGYRLPANELLAAEFGVSRVTIRQAVELLSQDGIIAAQQGRGTFVIGTLKQDRWLKVETTLSDLAEVYRDTSPEIINISESRTDAPLFPQDGKPAAKYVFMRRLHSRDKQPYCIISIYLDETVFRKFPKRFRNETVIPILKDLRDPRITSARQTLTIGTADLEAAKLLQIPLNSPVAEVRRVFTASDRTVIYLGEVTYRGEAVRVSASNPRDDSRTQAEQDKAHDLALWRAAQIAQTDRQIRAAQLDDDLAARATRRDRAIGIAGHRERRERVALVARGNRAEKRGTFRAVAQAVRCVLDVAAFEHAAVARQERRAHLELRIGGIRLLARESRALQQFFHGHRRFLS